VTCRWRQSMIPKSGDWFSEKIMLQEKLERDDDSKKVITL
jgi:hypothetical protein